MASEVKKFFLFDEFTEFLQLSSYTMFLLAHLYILTFNEDCFFFVFTGSVLICESTLSNGCLNHVDLIHCPKYCLLRYIFNGDSHIVPATQALSHSLLDTHTHTHTHTHTPLMEEKKSSSWKHDYDTSFSSFRCICHLVFALPDSKISPRYFSLLVFNCSVDYILTFTRILPFFLSEVCL